MQHAAASRDVHGQPQRPQVADSIDEPLLEALLVERRIARARAAELIRGGQPSDAERAILAQVGARP
jgi:hypothetical protein